MQNKSKEVDKKFGVSKKLTECFTDFRDQDRCHHTVSQLLRQRIYGICCGYEDLNDHNALREDPLFSLLVDKDLKQKVASKSTLNRLELCLADPNHALSGRYHKIIAHEKDIEHLFIKKEKNP